MADNELANMLSRRIKIEDGKEVDKKMKHYVDPRDEFAHPYPEFSEFTREQCTAYEEQFAQVDLNHNDYISYDELKHMLEKRGEPFTHLELKKLMETVDEDKDGQLSFREERAGDDTKNYEEEIREEQRKKNEAKRQAKRDKEAKEAKKAAFAKRAGTFGN